MSFIDLQTLLPVIVILAPIVIVIFRERKRGKQKKIEDKLPIVPANVNTVTTSVLSTVPRSGPCSIRNDRSLFIKPKRFQEVVIDTTDLNLANQHTLGKKIIIFFPDVSGVSFVLVSSAVERHLNILFDRGPKHLHTLKPMLAYSWYSFSKKCEPGGQSFSMEVAAASQEHLDWFTTTDCYKKHQLEIEKRYR